MFTFHHENTKIAFEQLRLLFTQAINVVYGTVAVVGVVTLVLWPAVDHFWLLLWAISSVFVNVVRMVFYRFYQRKQPGDLELRKWLRVYLVITFFVGLIWGSSGLLTLAISSPLYQSVIIIMLGGVALIGISVHGSSLTAYTVFAIPLMLPIIVCEFAYEDTVHIGLGANILIFLLILFAAARNYNRAILASLRLREENLELVKKAEVASKAKSEFLANMSHEIRTPLTAILGYSESALDNDQTPLERVVALRAIQRNSDHLLHIVNDILDFSKIEANRIETEHVEADYITIISEIEDLVSHLVRNKGLEYSVNYHFPLPAYIIGDPVRIKQVLLNLASNAIKFTETGSVEISVAFLPEQRVLEFCVVDTGIGMSREQLEKIFTPFEQADASISRRFGGTGLGLALSRRLVKIMGGTLEVRSNSGSGTTFELRLPCPDVEHIPLIQSLQNIPDKTTSAEPLQRRQLKGTVLLADDNPENLQLLSMLLGKMGVEVIPAVNGQEAISKAATHQVDMIYMDMQMPVVSGIEATRILRAQGFALPIVALTANATSEDREHCLEAGCNDFVTKPINRERLYQVTARFLASGASESSVPPIVSQLEFDDPAIQSILLQYVQSLPKTIEQLQTLQARQEWEVFKQLIHNLKGSGGNFGYPTLSALAERIELELKQGKLHTVTDLLAELARQAERIYLGVFPQSSDQNLRIVK
ncbi:MAG: ATP-binding protein [Gammaproteobacteria bacterium]